MRSAKVQLNWHRPAACRLCDGVLLNYKDYGFCGVIRKPYGMDDLSKTLNAVLGDGSA